MAIKRRKKTSRPAPPTERSRTIVEVVEDPAAGTEELYQHNIAVEVNEDDGAEAPKPFVPALFLPHCVVRVTQIGITFDHRLSERLKIAKHVEQDKTYGPNAYLLYSNGLPVYAYEQHIITDPIKPISFPTEQDIKTSSVDLYAKAVTYKRAWIRILRRKLRKDKDALNRTSKMIWIMGLIGVLLFMILMIAVSIVGGNDDEVATAPAVTNTSAGQQRPALVTDVQEEPEPPLTPEPAKGVPLD